MDLSSPNPLSPEPLNPWPLFPEQPIRERTAAELEAVPVHDRAGFWRRTAAFLLDLILLQWITILFLLLGAAAEDMAMAQPLGLSEGLSDAIVEWSEIHTQIWSLLFLIYFSFFTWHGGQTPGKMALSIRIVTTKGLAVTWPRSILRTLCYNLNLLTFGIGFLIAGIPPAKRALHDIVTGTIAVKINKS